ncbi:hypothetical protein EDD18DRAFT_1107383 [Armillaria luteobubalina]|uniref:Uncharacterized protein n=1 Tax=Armillaria luteobubalina TaxID=153913 RepID=A0AA39Q3W9_9AGAR|nr:hypothetical protein EDD18DRAFT_1107383 [Armillaria luteobubalina]
MKQLTILPHRIEYLPPRDGAAYLCDSRVHNKTITKGLTVDDWMAFLTGTMGVKPIHPDDAQTLMTGNDESGSESSDDESESDSEPWHLKWHQENPLPKNTLKYKLREHKIFLKYNIILINSEAVNAVRAFDNGRGLCPPMGMSQRLNPQGFPMTIWELKGMIRDIRNQQPHWKSCLYLLWEFFRISSSVHLEYCDLTTVMRLNNDWVDIRDQFDSLEPPEFMSMPAACLTSNPRNTNHGVGLYTVRDRNGHLFPSIVVRPQWYSLCITEINTAHPDALIEIANLSNILERMDWDGASRDLDEDDMIRYLASNGVTQAMIDSAYPYGLTFIDCGLSTDSTHTDFYSEVDQQWHILLNTYETLLAINAHQGWWYPDVQDIERIHVL